MAQFDIHYVITGCFIQAPMKIRHDIILTPWRGSGTMDPSTLLEEFAVSRLGQETFPEDTMLAQLNRVLDSDSSVIVSIHAVEAEDPHSTFWATLPIVNAIKESIALRQYNRGTLEAFITMQIDVDPNRFFLSAYNVPIRKVFHLSPSQPDVLIGSMVEELLTGDGRLSLYMSLYSDALQVGDRMRNTLNVESQLAKLWTLAETMAIDKQGSGKRGKVERLFSDHSLAVEEDFDGHQGMNHIAVAYELRNVIVHGGGCTSPSSARNAATCQRFARSLEQVTERLLQDSARLIESYAAGIQANRLPPTEQQAIHGFQDLMKVTFNGEDIPPTVEVIPGTASLLQMQKNQPNKGDSHE